MESSEFLEMRDKVLEQETLIDQLQEEMRQLQEVAKQYTTLQQQVDITSVSQKRNSFYNVHSVTATPIRP